MSDFPTVHDEATETPMWVPVLGIGLLVLAALSAIVRSTIDEVANPSPSAEAVPAAVGSPHHGHDHAPTPDEMLDMPPPEEALRRFLAGERE